MAPWLEIRGGSLRLGGRQVLSQIDLSVGPGVTVLLGRNGAGKTTLCRVCSGDLALDDGHVALAGGSLAGAAAGGRSELARLGWLPQSLRFPGSMRVVEAVRYAAWLKGATPSEAATQANRLVRQVDLEERSETRCRELSGGMERRLGLAAALAGDPAAVILDEPSAGLDPVQRDHLHSLIRQIAAERGVLLSTHLLEDVASVGDHVVVMETGRLIYSATVEDLGSGSRGPEELRTGLLRVLREAA